MSRPHDPCGLALRRVPDPRPQADRDAVPPPALRCSGLLPALWFALAALPGPAAAGPAPEYGPEAEARFLDRCADSGATARSCRRLMERLQAELGYAVFLDLADSGPEGFGRASDDRVAAAAPAAGTQR